MIFISLYSFLLKICECHHLPINKHFGLKNICSISKNNISNQNIIESLKIGNSILVIENNKPISSTSIIQFQIIKKIKQSGINLDILHEVIF